MPPTVPHAVLQSRLEGVDDSVRHLLTSSPAGTAPDTAFSKGRKARGGWYWSTQEKATFFREVARLLKLNSPQV